MLEGVPFRGRECVCGRICAYYVADSSVTPAVCHLLYLRGGINLARYNK